METRGTALASDGYELAVTRFPAEGRAWATLLCAGAMGVRQDFYAPFARFLAQHGVHVLTFDYRGMGWSRRGNLGGFPATVTDWTDKDFNAMLGEARKAASDLPLMLLGHSLGGQIFGAAPDNAGVRASLHVTAGSGWYRFNERMRFQVRLIWFVLMPLLTPLFGYFPGKTLRIVGDLPKGVARQWRRWCLSPDYLLSEGEGVRAAFARVHAPIRSYSFTDDALITQRAIDSLHDFYVNARVTRRHVSPADLGAKSIGHFGFFSERHRDTLWQEALDWLRSAGAAEGDHAQSIPREVLDRARALCGDTVELVPMPGLSHASVLLHRGARGAIVIKKTNPREARFYRDVRQQFLAHGIDTPQHLFDVAQGEFAWVGIEYVPQAFPRARFPHDAAILDTLAAVHAMRIEGSEPHWVLDWQDEHTRAVAAQFGPRREEIETALRHLQALPNPGPEVLVWGDANPLNWAMREDGRPVLLDWQRWGRGRRGYDLANTIPGLGDEQTYLRVANQYRACCAARGLEAPGSAELALDIRRSKAWACVELLILQPAAGSQLEKTQYWIRDVFADWVAPRASPIQDKMEFNSDMRN